MRDRDHNTRPAPPREGVEARRPRAPRPARPAPAAPRPRAPGDALAAMLRSPGALRRAVLLHEILGPPIALREEDR